MKCTVMFVGKENARWAFVKPESTIEGDLVINHQGAWQQFATDKVAGDVVTLPKSMHIVEGFWVA